MQELRDAGKEGRRKGGFRIGGMRNRKDAGREGYRNGGMQDKRDAGM